MSTANDVSIAAIEDRLTTFVIESLLLGKEIELQGVTSFLDAGIIDSTGVLELVQFLEDQFGFKVLDTEIVPENLDSLRALSTYVQLKLSQQGSVAEAAE